MQANFPFGGGGGGWGGAVTFPWHPLSMAEGSRPEPRHSDESIPVC